MDKIILSGAHYYWLGFLIGVLVTVFYFTILHTPKRRHYYRITWYNHSSKETIYKYISLEKEMSLNLYKYLMEEGIVNSMPNVRSNPMIKEIEVYDIENEKNLMKNPTLYGN